MAREGTLRRVRALLAKEGAEGTTPQEVAAAIAQANRLLEREGLTRAALEAEGAEPIEPAEVAGQPLYQARKLATWRIKLASTLGRAHGCMTLLSRGEIMLAGRPSDVEVTRYLFSYCAREVDRLAHALARGRGRTYSNNFRLGCVDAIRSAIDSEIKAEREAQRAAAVDTSALVAVDNAIAKREARYSEAESAAQAKFGRIGQRSIGAGSSYDAGARAHGRTAGAGIYPGRRSGVGAGAARGRIGS